ncbi:NEP1-interacting protein 1-like [Solanum verrucosum]|uniref:NEP1-interacting protein 1-like n=1 Tax=Solanum verrucosum TaxID=315347 RepID=UPI0020D0F07B|nr:NEP1-interacting protein 1-like [Solanum verrucosum]
MSHRSYLFGYCCDVNQLSEKQSSHDPSSSNLPLLNISSSLHIRHDNWYSNNVPQLYRTGVREETILKHMSFFLTSSVILSYDNFYFVISQLFGNWKLEFQDVRDSLVGNIMSQVRNIVESNKGYCGVLELSVDVKLVSRDVIEERILFPGEDLSSQYGMVPASESSMQSLLKKMEIDAKNTKGDECMVCLEELVRKQADNEILSMPCSHMFHGECITKWLETSHYCPICRFEMPVEEDN